MAERGSRHGPGGEVADALPAYEIGGVLGHGAFAMVYAARHTRLGREVAIKQLSSDLLRDRDARERFATEARLLATLDHPHVVRVYDYVETEDVCALVMERVRGETLGARMRRGRLSQAQSCAVALATLYGLEHAHQREILHRDVKPDNLLIDRRGLLKVADFGIARVLGARGLRLTITAGAPGTPAFMAPEQISKHLGPLSAATDVWAVGAVLYELHCGEAPFPLGDELGESLVRRATGVARPLDDVAPDVPQELAEIVMRALERDPVRRYPTAGAFAAALEPVAERIAGPGGLGSTGIPLHRTEALPQSAIQTLVEPSEADLLDSPPPARTRRGLAARIVGGGVAVAAAAVAAVLLLGGGGGDGGAAASTPPAPPGWPETLTIGYGEPVDGFPGIAQRAGPAAATFAVFGGDAAEDEDWSQDPERSPARFVSEARRAGVFPYAAYYHLRVLGQPGDLNAEAPQIRKTLADPELMPIYWRNVRRFLRQLGRANEPVAVEIESGVFALLQQQLEFSGGRPEAVSAVVGSSGLPELEDLPDNFPGFAQAWRNLRNSYAPKVVLAPLLTDYGANVDISRALPPEQTLIAAARAIAEFYLLVASNSADFAVFEIAFSEEGQNPTRSEIYSKAQKEAVVEFVREFVRVAQVPVVLDGVPIGNTASRAISDKPFHWRDSWVQWLLGDDDFSGARRLHEAGVIGLQFGIGLDYGDHPEPGQGATEQSTDRESLKLFTCPCDAARDGVTNDGRRGAPSTSADDDGGYFADRLAALQEAGGLALE